MAARLVEKEHLSAKGLLGRVRKVFEKVNEPRKGSQGRSKEIAVEDCLMSGLAIFKLKFSSLLQFDEAQAEEHTRKNLKNLFGVEKAPSDTYLRERLDEIDPRELRPAFKSVFAALQRGKQLENYEFLEGKYLLLSDGTGYYSSKHVHCKYCCEKHHKDGAITYYHQMMGAVIAHPDLNEVIPLCPEPIMKEDGATKNDCERNASERLLRDFRREHPHLPVIVTEDALASNGPHLKLLKELGMNHITVVKPDGNKALFDWVKAFDWREENRSDWDKSQGAYSFVDREGKIHKFRYVNHASLNDTHPDLKVNFLEYWEFDKEEKQLYHNTWITDILITNQNIYTVTKGGRARWRIENETFNTLKNQGYNFEHNYGHGHEHLSTVFVMLMMLAFLIDQTEQICCGIFQAALKKLNSRKSRLWTRIREFFGTYIIPSWEVLYRAIIAGDSRIVPILDSS